MINHIQLNMNNTKNCGFITDDIFVTLTQHFKEYNNYDKISNYIDNVIVKYYIDINKIIISYLNFVIRNKDIIINNQFLKLVEYITHHNDKGATIKKYFILSLNDYISSL